MKKITLITILIVLFAVSISCAQRLVIPQKGSYNFEINTTICFVEPEQFKEILIHYYGKNYDRRIIGVTAYNSLQRKQVIYIVRINGKFDTSVIGHEILHVICNVAGYIDIEHYFDPHKGIWIEDSDRK